MLSFEGKLDEYRADLKVRRLTREVYDAIDQLVKLQPTINELKKSVEAKQLKGEMNGQ
jgi:hypothetical protein